MTPAARDGDYGFGVSAVTGLCGGAPAGVPCVTLANDANHVYIGMSDDTATPNNQAFYITVF